MSGFRFFGWMFRMIATGLVLCLVIDGPTWAALARDGEPVAKPATNAFVDSAALAASALLDHRPSGKLFHRVFQSVRTRVLSRGPRVRPRLRRRILRLRLVVLRMTTVTPRQWLRTLATLAAGRKPGEDDRPLPFGLRPQQILRYLYPIFTGVLVYGLTHSPGWLAAAVGTNYFSYLMLPFLPHESGHLRDAAYRKRVIAAAFTPLVLTIGLMWTVGPLSGFLVGLLSGAYWALEFRMARHDGSKPLPKLLGESLFNMGSRPEMRNALIFLFVGQIFNPIPWSLPFQIDQAVHAPAGLRMVWTLLSVGGYWLGKGINRWMSRSAHFGQRPRLAWGIGFIGTGLLLILLSFTTTGWAWPLLSVLIGFTYHMNVRVARRQVKAAVRDRRDGAFAAYDAVVYAGAALGNLVMAWLNAGVGAREALQIDGMLKLVFPLAMIIRPLREFLLTHPRYLFALLTTGAAAAMSHSLDVALGWGLAVWSLIWILQHAAFWSVLHWGHRSDGRGRANLVYDEPERAGGASTRAYAPEDSKLNEWQPHRTDEVTGLDVQDVEEMHISDTHFRSLFSRARLGHDMLKHHRFKRLYLWGDIVDYFVNEPMTQEQRDVLHYIGDLRRAGVEVLFVPGNHDWLFKPYAERAEHESVRRIKLYKLEEDPKQTRQEEFDIKLDHVWNLGGNPDRPAYGQHGDRLDIAGGDLEKVGSHIYEFMLARDEWLRNLREDRGLFSEEYLARLGKKIAKEQLGDYHKLAALAAYAKGVRIAFVGHDHNGGMEWVEITDPVDGHKELILVVDTGNWQNPVYASAVTVLAGGQLQYIEWRQPHRDGELGRVRQAKAKAQHLWDKSRDLVRQIRWRQIAFNALIRHFASSITWVVGVWQGWAHHSVLLGMLSGMSAYIGLVIVERLVHPLRTAA